MGDVGPQIVGTHLGCINDLLSDAWGKLFCCSVSHLPLVLTDKALLGQNWLLLSFPGPHLGVQGERGMARRWWKAALFKRNPTDLAETAHMF